MYSSMYSTGLTGALCNAGPVWHCCVSLGQTCQTGCSAKQEGWFADGVPTSSAASADKTAAHCSVDVKMSGTLEEHLKKVHTLSQNVEFLLCVQPVLSDAKKVSRGCSWAILEVTQG